MNSSVNIGERKRRMSQPEPAQLQLPYLKPSKPMTYVIDDDERPLKKPRDFNLCTANTKLPKY